jgi:small subunit ribosomal protein S6
MSEIKNDYEVMFIVNSTIGDDAISATVEKFKTLISQNGEITKVDEIGKRRLAYPIAKMNEGHYVLCQFTAPTDFPLELERIFNITDEIIRFLVTAKGE